MTKRGFTLIEVIIGMAVFLIVAGALFGLTQLIFENIGQTRVRHTARLLATEKLEEARNLTYDSLGTVGGIPAGPALQSESIQLGGINFVVATSITYVDDPYDGTAPTDTLSTDYKRIRIAVSWAGLFPSGGRPVVLVSDVTPKGIETAVGGGTLSILVFDSVGTPVAGAQAQVTNTEANPNINIDVLTDSFGRVTLPGSPNSIEGYKVTVTRDGYSTDRTYGSEEVTNPSKPHLTVLEGEVTEASFAIDRTSTLTLTTTSPNVDLRLWGSKIVGTDASENEIYKYDEIVQTDGSGSLTLSNVEFDNYNIEVTDVNYDFAGSNPAFPYPLLPDTNVNISLGLAPNSPNSLLVFVEDDQNNPVATASARLVNVPSSYDEIIETGALPDPDFGYAYFGSLSNLQYQLTVSLAGYEEATASVQVNQDTFTNVLLNPI